MNESLNIIINRITQLAEEDCICSEAQELGNEYPECIYCMAGYTLNSIGELAREFLRDIK